MAEKQSVSGVVTKCLNDSCELRLLPTAEYFWWPYAIPEGTPVKVTVEVGGKARKVKGA